MDFDFDCASHGGGQWMGESASRRRQRRLSSPSLRAYLTPAFDAVAAEGGGIPGSPASSFSSGGLELGFDASLLRYRRTCFSSSAAELDSRRLLYSSPPPPPPLPQARAVYPVADHGVFLAGGYRYGPKRQAGGLSGPPGYYNFKPQFSNATRPAVDLRSPEDTAVLANKVAAELFSTPEPEAAAAPSAQATPQPPAAEEEDDLIAEVLYGQSGRRRLPIFRDICPE